MICLFMILKDYYSVGNALALSFGIVIFLMAFIPVLICIACNYSTRIRLFIWKFLATLTVFFTELGYEDEDDPVMPSEYADWASSKKWRESCIRKEDRRM